MRARIVTAIVIAAAVCALTVSHLMGAGPEDGEARKDRLERVPDAARSDISLSVDKGEGAGIPLDSVSMVVIYDNNPGAKGLRAEWGFSCLVGGPAKTILFDTGGEGDVLMANMAALGLDPGEIDAVVLSHFHGDHTGGLSDFLEANHDVDVYVPACFSEGYKRKTADRVREVVEVDDAVTICENVFSTGEMGTSIREQGLVLRTDRGLIVITGCAHPGIVGMVERAVALYGGDVLFVFGGFHLARAGDGEIADVIAGLKHAGVRYAAPCHCSGDRAREMFREAFGPGYVEVSVGRSLGASDLTGLPE